MRYKPSIDGALGKILERYSARCTDDDTKAVYEQLTAFVLRPGKRFRPLLTILAYHGYSDKDPTGKIFDAAAAMELLHAFMLIHDDIVDKSDTRRGEPSLHKTLGDDVALIVGDLAYTIALQAIADLETEPEITCRLLSRVLAMTHDTGVGQLMDVLHSKKPLHSLKIDDVRKATILKTARYSFDGPLQVGAILAGVDDAELQKLSKVALPLGEAFQLHDDIDELESGVLETSLPLVHAYSEGNAEQRAALISGNTELMKATLRHSGSISHVKSVINTLQRQTKNSIDVLGMHLRERQALHELTERLLE